MKQNLLITGASGLLGHYLCRYFATDYKVTALYHRTPLTDLVGDLSGVAAVQADLSEPRSLQAVLKQHQPDILIHAAGLTSVDLCEENPAMAKLLNVEMTQRLLESLNPATRLIHLSTDHLFSGEQSLYNEKSPTQPLNVYAQTKLSAEKLLSSYENAVVIRTNFYGGRSPSKKSFSNWVYDALKANQTLPVFDDVYYSPISVCGLAENIEKLISSELRGIYNVVGSERLSKFEFANRLARFFDLNPNLIVRSQILSASLRASRPRDMSLSIEKIKSDLPDFVQESVETGLSKIQSQHLI
jgi:dTDP-4-dehydrorhamnose reductase